MVLVVCQGLRSQAQAVFGGHGVSDTDFFHYGNTFFFCVFRSCKRRARTYQTLPNYHVLSCRVHLVLQLFRTQPRRLACCMDMTAVWMHRTQGCFTGQLDTTTARMQPAATTIEPRSIDRWLVPPMIRPVAGRSVRLRALIMRPTVSHHLAVSDRPRGELNVSTF